MQRPRLPHQASGPPDSQRERIRKFSRLLAARTSALQKQCSTARSPVWQSYGLGAKVCMHDLLQDHSAAIFPPILPLDRQTTGAGKSLDYLLSVSMDWQMRDPTWCKLPSAWHTKCVRSESWRSMTNCSARSSAFSFSDPLSRSAPTTFWSAPFGAFCEAQLSKVRLRREDLHHMYRRQLSISHHCCAVQVCLL